ncbi:MAG: YdhR family protein [Pseudomonadota bacterium]|nr:YdhR family protein [Pseudomonadota bacterium]
MESIVNVTFGRVSASHHKHSTRRKPRVLSAVLSGLLALLAGSSVFASGSDVVKAEPKAFVYTELQMSVPFENIPWHRINTDIKKQPGFINKTWLAGVGNESGGGLYAFDSIENAQKFVTGYFPAEAKSFGVAQTTRVFDAEVTKAASMDMNSVYYNGTMKQKPGAYVYTEVQLHVVPFDNGPWRQLNPVLKKQPGLLSKTWLSGLNTGTPGGLYAFDTLENAQKFAIEYFPTEAAGLNAAFYTRVFDANITESASREMNSPFYN